MENDLKRTASTIRAFLDNADDSRAAITTEDVRGFRAEIEERYPELRGYVEAIMAVEQGRAFLAVVECRPGEGRFNRTEDRRLDSLVASLLRIPKPSDDLLRIYAFLCDLEPRLAKLERAEGTPRPVVRPALRPMPIGVRMRESATESVVAARAL